MRAFIDVWAQALTEAGVPPGKVYSTFRLIPRKRPHRHFAVSAFLACRLIPFQDLWTCG